jgi:Epoxide hydrolase N terminus
MSELATNRTATNDATIRPFNIDVPQADVDDMRRRIAATRWPDRETVTDDSQGVSLATMQALARYLGTDYDWRKCEATLNALPQFMTVIDGLDIHFIHVRSQHETRCLSSSRTGGRARSSSSSRSSSR